MGRENIKKDGGLGVSTVSTQRRPVGPRSSAVRWQLMVTPMAPRSNTQASNPLFRVDKPHDISTPNLPLYWTSHVGPQQITVSQSSAAAARPRMLDARGLSPNHLNRNSILRTNNLAAVEATPKLEIDGKSDQGWSSLIEMSSPLAYELQNSLALASETLQAIATKVRLDNPLSLSDAQQLSSTADNLDTLSSWSDDILLSLKAQHGKCQLIRRRFRVRDWQNSLSNLLDGIASQRQIRVEWFGWDDDHPNLYLDPSIINKAFYNLAKLLIQNLPSGCSLRLLVGQQSPGSRNLLVTIQTDKDVLCQESIQIINGTARPAAYSIENIAILTAKKLIALHGGSLTAHRDLNGGCDLRITLPVDSAQSLVCGWLITNFQQGELSKDCYAHLYAVKLDGGDAERANIGLHRAASNRSLVIRISKSRWLILELKSIGQFTSTSDTARKAMSAIRERDQISRRTLSGYDSSGSTSSFDQTAPVWLETLVYRTGRINEDSLWSPAASHRRLPQLVEDIAAKTEELMSRQQLIMDGFASTKLTNSSENTSESLELRRMGGPIKAIKIAACHSVQQANITNPKSFGVGIKPIEQRDSHPAGERELATGTFSNDPSSDGHDGRDSIDAPGAQVVGEIIRQWKIVQAKLAELNGSLSNCRAG